MSDSISSGSANNAGIFRRAFGWLWRNGWRLAILLLGLLVLGIGLLLQFYHGWYHYNEYGYASLVTISGASISGVTGQSGYHQYADETYVLWLLAGMILSCAGFFLLRRRFSLRTLIAAAVLTALVGSLPKILPRPDRGRYYYFSLNVPVDWPAAQRQALCDELQKRFSPESLNREFPEEARTALGLGTANPFRKSEEREKNEHIMARYTELSPALNDQQIAALAEFQADYLNEVLTDFCARNGQKVGVTLPFSRVGGRWSEFRKAWLENRKP